MTTVSTASAALLHEVRRVLDGRDDPDMLQAATLFESEYAIGDVSAQAAYDLLRILDIYVEDTLDDETQFAVDEFRAAWALRPHVMARA